MGDSRIKDVSSLLSSFLNEDKLRHGEHFAEFFDAWPSLVGTRFASHSHVVDIDKGLLIVEAEHPGWIQLLQMRQSKILEDAVRRYPELGLRGIAFKLASQAEKVKRASVPAGEPSNKTLEVEDLQNEAPQANALEQIADPEFRALLKGLRDSLQGKP